MPLEFVGGKVSGSAGFGAGHFGGGVRSLAGGWRGGVHSMGQGGDCWGRALNVARDDDLARLSVAMLICPESGQAPTYDDAL